MIKVGKFLKARAVGTAPRETYRVFNARSLDVVGMIEWYPRWRAHVFQPELGSEFSEECLRDLAGFLENCDKASKVLAR